MQNVPFFIIPFFLVFMFSLLYLANNKLKKVENKKIYYAHNFLLLFATLVTAASVWKIITLVVNFKVVVENAKVVYQTLPSELSVFIVIFDIILNVTALFLAFFMAYRVEMARKIFVVIIPLIFVLGLFGGIDSLSTKNLEFHQFGFNLLIYAIVTSISYLPLFLFYTNKNVKATLFLR
ncbi:MAG: hypothetical protein ACK5LP_02225 [Campylobacteraceae bacterium]